MIKIGIVRGAAVWAGGLFVSLSAATYTLDALIETGFKNSKEIKIVEEEMAKAEAQVKEYNGKALPKIDFSANLQHAFSQFNPFSSGSLGPPEGTPTATDIITRVTGYTAADSMLASFIDGFSSMFSNIDLYKDNTAAVGLSISQPIFAQGKVLTGMRIAKLYNRSLLCKWQDIKMQVKADITKLFYGALLAEKNLAIQVNAITLAKDAHRLAVLRFQEGRGNELDTLKTRLALGSAVIAHQGAQKDRKMALDALIKKTSVSDGIDDIILAGDFPDKEYTIDLQQAIQYVQNENKKVVQLNVAREIQYELVKLARSDYLPIVYCGGSLSKITQFDAGDDIQWQNDQKVFVGLSYTLFNGMQRAQKIKQAKADAHSTEKARELALDGFALMTRSAWENLETSRKGLEQAKSLCALAEKAYTISKKAYELGGITLLEYQNSEQMMNNALLGLNAAQFGFHNAVVDMRLLMGDYLYDDTKTTEPAGKNP